MLKCAQKLRPGACWGDTCRTDHIVTAECGRRQHAGSGRDAKPTLTGPQQWIRLRRSCHVRQFQSNHKPNPIQEGHRQQGEHLELPTRNWNWTTLQRHSNVENGFVRTGSPLPMELRDDNALSTRSGTRPSTWSPCACRTRVNHQSPTVMPS